MIIDGVKIYCMKNKTQLRKGCLTEFKNIRKKIQ